MNKPEICPSAVKWIPAWFSYRSGWQSSGIWSGDRIANGKRNMLDNVYQLLRSGWHRAAWKFFPRSTRRRILARASFYLLFRAPDDPHDADAVELLWELMF